MTLPKVVHGGIQKPPVQQKFNPRPKNAIDRKADAILGESLDAANRPVPDRLTKHVEKAGEEILKRQSEGK